MDRLKRNLSVKSMRSRTISKQDSELFTADNDEPKDILLVAASDGALSDVKSLIKKGHNCNVQDSNGYTALHCAAMNGKLTICKYLLGHSGVDVGILTREQASVYHYLVRIKDLPGSEEKLWTTVMDLTKKRGCDVNHPNKHMETPLHSACMRGNELAVKFLLANGADPDMITSMGETALHYAIRISNLNIVTMLLEKGANPLIQSDAGTPKEVAVEYNRMDILEILTQYTQKFVKQQKRAVSVSALPNIHRNKQGSILSDLIDTSQHTPNNNMVKPQKREVSSTYQANPPLERGVSFQNADKKGGGGNGRGVRHHSMMSTSQSQLVRGVPPSPSPRSKKSPRSSNKSPRSHSPSHSNVSFKAHGKMSPDDLNGNFANGSENRVTRIQSMKTIRKESLRDDTTTAAPLSSRTHSSSSSSSSSVPPPHVSEEVVEKKEDVREEGREERRVNFGGEEGKGDEEKEITRGKKIKNKIASVPNMRNFASDYIPTTSIPSAPTNGPGNPPSSPAPSTSIHNIPPPLAASSLITTPPAPPSSSSSSSSSSSRLSSVSTSNLHVPSHNPKNRPLSQHSGRSSGISPGRAAKSFVHSTFSVSSSATASISSSFARTASNLIPLYKDGALKKGYLDVFRARKWLRLWCVLKERSLIFYSSPNTLEEVGDLDVTSAKINTSSAWKDKPNAFDVTVKTKTTIFSPETKREKEEWITLLKSVSDFYEDASTGSPALSRRSEPGTPISRKLISDDIINPQNQQQLKRRENLLQTQNNLSHLIYALQSPSSSESPEDALSRLLLDSSYTAVMGLLSIAQMENDEDEFIKALVAFFDAFDSAPELLHHFTTEAITSSREGSTLFRDSSCLATKLSTVYFNLVGRGYLLEVIFPVVSSIASHRDSLEVNPNRRGGGEVDVHRSIEILLEVAQSFLDRVFSTSHKVPRGIRQVLSIIRVETAKVYPEMEEVALGAFIFLRFFCPAIVSPEVHGIIGEGVLTNDHRRALVLISKLLQNLANHVEFDGSKEAYMTQFNNFIIKNLVSVKQYLKDVSVDDQTNTNPPEDKKDKQVDSLLWILRYINSKQSLIAELMAVKL